MNRKSIGFSDDEALLLNLQLPKMMECGSASIDRTRVIQRSVRCFYFGLIGLIPVIGLVMAVLAIRLYHRVLEETRERPAHPLRWGVIGLKFLVCWTAFTVASAMDVPLLVLFILLFLVIQVFLATMRYWPVKAAVWNPARPQLFWGYQLAINGFFISFLVVGGVLVRVGLQR